MFDFLIPLLDAISGQFLPALAVAFAVFLVVLLASKTGLLKSGDYQRIGVVVSALFLSGYEWGDIESGITTVVGALLATLLNEFKNFLGKQAETKKSAAG